MADALNFLRERSDGKMQAIGIGSFGPVDLSSSSPTFGHITSTPKIAWRNFNFVGTVRAAFDVPIGFDTDVNAAALGEARWGAAQSISDFVHLTVGTGIGGGVSVTANFSTVQFIPTWGTSESRTIGSGTTIRIAAHFMATV